MKPIKLMMRAFGPYKNREVIDFTKLHEHGLFVISGATGAGKTTIFDAICFALYGLGSGQDRKDVKMLRSNFADDNVHTAVELIFELHGRTYRVFRQLPHVKKNRKTATGDKYELFEILQNGEEKPVVERQRVSDINKKLEEIIGLTYDQFSQIVMLPQGEFRKLLTSQSDNKEEILRKIFKTNRYGNMALKLEEKKKVAEQQLNEAKAIKNSYIGQISGALPQRESLLFNTLEQNSNIYQIITGLDDEKKYYEEKILIDEKLYEKAFLKHKETYERYIAAKSLNDQIEAFEKKKIQLKETEEQKPFFDQVKENYEASIRASKIAPLDENRVNLEKEKAQYIKQFEEVSVQLEKMMKQLKETENKYHAEKEKQHERDEAEQKVRELEKLVPLYKEVEDMEKNIQSLQKEKDSIERMVFKTETEITEKQKKVEEIQNTVESLEKDIEKLPTSLEKQMHLREVLTVLETYKQLTQKSNQLSKQLEDAQNHLENIKTTYEQEERAYLNNQAAVLAATLVPGEPCPVCGSTEHKNIHIDSTNEFDEKNLKQLKTKLIDAEQCKYKVEANYQTCLQQVNENKEKLLKFQVEASEYTKLNNQLKKLNKYIKTLQNNQKQLKIEKEQLKQLQQQIISLEGRKKEKELSLKEKSETLTKQQTILEQKRLDIPKDLKLLEQLQQAIQAAKQTREDLVNCWEQVQTNYSTMQKKVVTAEQRKKYTEELVEKTKTKLEITTKEFQSLMQSYDFETYEQFKQAKQPENIQQQWQQQYMDFTNKLYTLETQVKEEAERLQGKEKMDLTILEQQVNELKKEYEQAYQKLNTSKECKRLIEGFINKLEAISESIYELEQSSNKIVQLYNLLRGQNNKKISFERYVQMGYLEQITEAANIRLKNLSNGQYFLQVSDRQESHGRQSGLSLDVYDTYTGQTRDVKTLSGGEKFNASLSLALGMADIIQDFQGSVVIDTMFIDEGFGSLDEEALMKAIDTLIDLQKSGRLIGVISHVSELKNAMPAILQVEKLKEGYSKTSIILK